MGKPALAEAGQPSAHDYLMFIGDAADEMRELIPVLSAYIAEHGSSETSLLARGILHRVYALVDAIYTAAHEPGGHEELLKLLGPAGA